LTIQISFLIDIYDVYKNTQFAAPCNSFVFGMQIDGPWMHTDVPSIAYRYSS